MHANLVRAMNRAEPELEDLGTGTCTHSNEAVHSERESGPQ